MIDLAQCGLVYKQGDKEVVVYENFDLHVEQGESIVLIGPSGCGKSTMLYLLAGLRKPTSGKVQINGEEVIKPRQQTGFILQEYGLFPWLTVEKNVGLGLKVRHRKRKEISFTVQKVLNEMDILGVKQHYPSQLSGGQRQRVALARALSLEPDLLLMDEPLSSLDALTRERIQQLLLSLWQRGTLTTVLVTHSIEEAVFLGSRILVLQGPPVR